MKSDRQVAGVYKSQAVVVVDLHRSNRESFIPFVFAHLICKIGDTKSISLMNSAHQLDARIVIRNWKNANRETNPG